MFTGIVEEKGRVLSFAKGENSWRLTIAVEIVARDAAIGDSIAVNGCCVTVTEFDEHTLTFDVLEETRLLTNFAEVREAGHVNLERSLRFDGKVGGHFVTGHIDETGRVDVFERRGTDYYLRVKCSAAGARLVVHKGSVAIDGVSLTVAEVTDESFAVWLIPTTLDVTNLGEKRPGDMVNLEFDLLGKYVEKFTRNFTDR